MQAFALGSQRGITMSEELNRYITFSMGGELFALPLLSVKEVIAYAEVTPIPGAPHYFKGIMDLRGEIVSVMDLAEKLTLPAAQAGAETSIIILDLGEVHAGVIVDNVDSVITLRKGDLSAPPDMKLNIKNYLGGVTKKDNRLVLLLDVGSALTEEDFHTLKTNSRRAA